MSSYLNTECKCTISMLELFSVIRETDSHIPSHKNEWQFTCRALPGGSCIMTSEMVCRKVWNTMGRGLTASPAMLMSDRGCSHTTSLSWGKTIYKM